MDDESLTKQFVKGSWDGTHDRIGGLLGGVGPSESLKSGNSHQRCSSQLPAPSCSSLLLLFCGCSCRQVRAQAQVPGVSEVRKELPCGGWSWNGRTAGWLLKSKSAHVADAVLLLINMTLNFVCALVVAGLVPVASVCPSQDRHEPWLLERPNGSTPKNQLRVDAGADMTKLELGRGHSRDPNFP